MAARLPPGPRGSEGVLYALIPAWLRGDMLKHQRVGHPQSGRGSGESTVSAGLNDSRSPRKISVQKLSIQGVLAKELLHSR